MRVLDQKSLERSNDFMRTEGRGSFSLLYGKKRKKQEKTEEFLLSCKNISIVHLRYIAYFLQYVTFFPENVARFPLKVLDFLFFLRKSPIS